MSPDVPCCTFCSSGATIYHWVTQILIGLCNLSTRLQIPRVTIWNTRLHSYRRGPTWSVICIKYRGYCVFGGWFINFVVSCTSCTIRIKVILKTYVVHPPLKYFFFFFARDACLKGQTYFIHFCFLFPVICFISSEMFWFFSLSRWNLSNRKNVVVSYKKVI